MSDVSKIPDWLQKYISTGQIHPDVPIDIVGLWKEELLQRKLKGEKSISLTSLRSVLNKAGYCGTMHPKEKWQTGTTPFALGERITKFRTEFMLLDEATRAANFSDGEWNWICLYIEGYPLKDLADMAGITKKKEQKLRETLGLGKVVYGELTINFKEEGDINEKPNCRNKG